MRLLILLISSYLLFSCDSNTLSKEDTIRIDSLNKLVASVQTFSSFANDDCGEILQWGIWDYSKIKSKEEFASSLYLFLQTNKIADKQKTMDVVTAAEIMPADFPVPMNFDGTYGSTKKDYYSEALVSEILSNETYKKDFEEENIQANGKIVDAWSNCKQIRERGGLFSNPIFTSNDVNLNLAFDNYTGDKTDVYLYGDNIKRTLEAQGLKLKSEIKKKVKLYPKIAFPIIVELPKNDIDLSFVIRTSSDKYICPVHLRRIVDDKPIYLRKYGTSEAISKSGNVPGFEGSFEIINTRNEKVFASLMVSFSFKTPTPHDKPGSVRLLVWDATYEESPNNRNILVDSVKIDKVAGDASYSNPSYPPKELALLETSKTESKRIIKYKFFDRQNIHPNISCAFTYKY